MSPFDWFKKEKPMMGMQAMGGGAASFLMHVAAGGGSAPTWTATGGDSVYPSVPISGTNYKIHKFTSPGNFVISPGSGSYDVIVIAGGGSGGVDNGGGGGAGGVVDATVPDAIVSNGTFGVSIGNGGAVRPGPSNDGPGNKGSNSTFVVSPTITLTANGGGAGNGWASGSPGPTPGGSGGGNSCNSSSLNPIGPGSATQPGTNPSPWVTDLGNAGGNAWLNPDPTYYGYAGGGGGAGGAGSDATSPDTAGYGGLGYLTNGKYGKNPVPVFGGGLDEYPSGDGVNPTGRIAGGGTGGWNAWGSAPAPPNLNTAPNPHNGVTKNTGITPDGAEPSCVANTGGGGHGANHDNQGSGGGGSGVVVIRYVA